MYYPPAPPGSPASIFEDESPRTNGSDGSPDLADISTIDDLDIGCPKACSGCCPRKIVKPVVPKTRDFHTATSTTGLNPKAKAFSLPSIFVTSEFDGPVIRHAANNGNSDTPKASGLNPEAKSFAVKTVPVSIENRVTCSKSPEICCKTSEAVACNAARFEEHNVNKDPAQDTAGCKFASCDLGDAVNGHCK